MKYCSLDLELTGFDPLTDEILEIGLAFFEPTPKGLQITEQWSQTFRPKSEVHPKILGLTGLTMAELQQAPLLTDLHSTVQKKLEGAVIVGHNIILDARFLEAFGFKLSGQFIDTLDLVQFLLPTHHSYNLENLMHHLGIPHKEAHRALGDSLATIALLEQLLRRYNYFPIVLKQRMQGLIAGRNLIWQELFSYPFEFPQLVQSQAQELTPVLSEIKNFPTIESGSVILTSLDQTTPQVTAQALQVFPASYLLVVPDKSSVLKMWQQGLARALFSPQDRFDPVKFNQWLERNDLDQSQLMFVLKILVWFHTNWQTETIIDLNLTFFGGQFRSMISGRAFVEENTAQLVCCDYETFTLLSEARLYLNRVPVLWNAHKLEQWLSEGSQGRLTWNKALYLLKGIYNPETDFGQVRLREPVMTALAGADLFFSLVNLEVRRSFPGQDQVSFDTLCANDFVFRKLQTAAQNFLSKVKSLTQGQEKFPELSKFAAALEAFFQPTADRVKWVEVTEFNSIFVDRPLHVAPLLQKVLKPYAKPAVVDNLPNEELLQYILQRLGLFENMTITNLEQQKSTKVKLVLHPQAASEQEIFAALEPNSLPAAVIFGSKAEVRQFYDNYYLELKQFAAVFAQSYSGGSNKILRNFGIRPASILLATPSFVIRSNFTLALRTVIILNPPNVNFRHPYFQALRHYWEPILPNFAHLQAMLETYLLIQTIYTPQLEQVELFFESDSTLTDLQKLPFWEISP